MSRSTTHRYVITLVALGYLEQGASRKYRLGLRVTDLGMSALNSTGLREHARPYLKSCASGPPKRPAWPARRHRDPPTSTASQLPPWPAGTELDLHPGSRLPAYCTAMGKLLLANLPEPAQQRELLAELTLAKRGPNTITTKKALREELGQFRGGALVITTKSSPPGCTRSRLPCATRRGETVAAVSLSAPAPAISIQEMVDALGPHLIVRRRPDLRPPGATAAPASSLERPASAPIARDERAWGTRALGLWRTLWHPDEPFCEAQTSTAAAVRRRAHPRPRPRGLRQRRVDNLVQGRRTRSRRGRGQPAPTPPPRTEKICARSRWQRRSSADSAASPAAKKPSRTSSPRSTISKRACSRSRSAPGGTTATAHAEASTRARPRRALSRSSRKAANGRSQRLP